MPKLIVAAIIVGEGDKILASARAYPADLAGRFEFAGGKVEDGEDPRDALVRELDEELHLAVSLGPAFRNPHNADGTWPLDGGRKMATWWARPLTHTTPLLTSSHLAHVWQPRERLSELNWLAPDRPIATLLERTPPPL